MEYLSQLEAANSLMCLTFFVNGASMQGLLGRESTEVFNIRRTGLLYLPAPFQLLCTRYRASKRSHAKQATLSSQPSRCKHLLIFGTLAIVSLRTTWCYMLTFFTLSYETWVQEVGCRCQLAFRKMEGSLREVKTLLNYI